MVVLNCQRVGVLNNIYSVGLKAAASQFARFW